MVGIWSSGERRHPGLLPRRPWGAPEAVILPKAAVCVCVCVAAPLNPKETMIRLGPDQDNEPPGIKQVILKHIITKWSLIFPKSLLPPPNSLSGKLLRYMPPPWHRDLLSGPQACQAGSHFRVFCSTAPSAGSTSLPPLPPSPFSACSCILLQVSAEVSRPQRDFSGHPVSPSQVPHPQLSGQGLSILPVSYLFPLAYVPKLLVGWWCLPHRVPNIWNDAWYLAGAT